LPELDQHKTEPWFTVIYLQGEGDEFTYAVHTHTHLYTSACTQTHTYTHTHAHTHAHKHLHTHTHTHACTQAHTYTHTHPHPHCLPDRHTQTHTHLLAQTHTHLHKMTHTRTSTRGTQHRHKTCRLSSLCLWRDIAIIRNSAAPAPPVLRSSSLAFCGGRMERGLGGGRKGEGGRGARYRAGTACYGL